jgi:HEAT repeat protein
MDIFQSLPPEVQKFIVDAGVNTVGGLGTIFAERLIGASVRTVRTFFGEPDERTAALNRAVSVAVLAAVKDWAALPEEYEQIWQKYSDWLLEPVVVAEFRKLLTPTPDLTLDFPMLCEEFAAAGLAVADLGKPDFDALIQDMVGLFYLAAAEEPLLQEPLKIGVLRQVAEGIDALTRLQAQEVRLERRSLGELERLNLMAAAVVDGQTDELELLRAILAALENLPQDLSTLQLGYQATAVVLSRADLGDLIGAGNNSVQRDSASPELTAAISQLNQRLAEIAELLATPHSALSDVELAQLEQNYRQTLIDQFEMLTFRGITPSGKALALKLEEVYVELKTIAEVPEAADTYSADERRFMVESAGELERAEAIAHLDALRLERWRSEARQQRQEQIKRRERKSIAAAINDPTQRGLVILGDPGAGKSTLLHYLALTHARRALGETLPIFVPLAAYDDYCRRNDAGLALADFLPIYYEHWRSLPGLAPLFQQALASGRALLLLDGLDEVLETVTRQHVAEQAGSLIAQWQARGNRFVLTSRVVGYREARLPGDLPHVTVLDFGPTEIKQFAHQWCRAFEIWAAGRASPTALQAAAAEEANLLDDVRSNPSVEQLAANPLLLTMLAILRRQVGKLPDRRVELYERYVRTLIDNREEERSRGARRHTLDRFDPHRALRHLMDLALWLQLHRAAGTARRRDLEEALAQICLRYEGYDSSQPLPPKVQDQAQKEAAAFLHDMRAIAGLLAERGRDAFGFLHLTFQEYFAGRALARLTPAERWATLQPHLHKPRWREPILLCAGQLGVIEQRDDLATDFVQRILHAESEDEALLHRDLFLAAAAMADNVGLAPALLKELYERTALLRTSAVTTIQNAALTALTHLARIGQADALDLLITGVADRDRYQPILTNVKPQLNEKALSRLQRAITAKLDDADSDVRSAAVSALASLVATDEPTKAAITAKLHDDDNNVRRAAVSALASLVATDEPTKAAITAKLNDDDNNVRSAAVSALASLVATDEPTKAAITAKLHDGNWQVRRAAFTALASLVASDEPTKAAITAKLHDDDSDVRSAAVSALASLVATDEPTKAAITAKLHDDDNNVRSAAVSALASLVATDEPTKAAITAKLHDDDSDVRSATVSALASLVATDEPTKAAITAKLDDDGNNVCRAAVSALASLVATDEPTKAAITAKLDDADWFVRSATVSALASLVATDEPTKAAITAKLNDAEWGVRRAAVNALTSLVASDEPTKATIIAKLHDAANDVRSAAVNALASLVATDEPTKAAIITKLDDDSYDMRGAAVSALTSLVATDEPTKAAITAKLHDDDNNVRRAAFTALASLVASDEPTKAAIITKLDDADYDVRSAAVSALASLVATDEPTKATITAKLDDAEWVVRRAAVSALASLVATDEPTKVAITAKLDDAESEVRSAAVSALASLVATDEPTKAAITAKLHDAAWNVRDAAVNALASLVATDEPTKAAITAKFDDADYDVRRAAVSALASLVATDEPTKATIITKLDDAEWDVRDAAVNALASLVATDEPTKATIITKLNDAEWDVRDAAVNALASLVATDEPTKAAITAKLDDADSDVRSAAVNALASLVASDEPTKAAITAKLDDAAWVVRRAAVMALASLMATDEPTKAAITAKLNDADWFVRRAAVLALLPHLDKPTAFTLLPWLGTIADSTYHTGSGGFDHNEIRQQISTLLAQRVMPGNEFYEQLVAWLDVRAWPLRQGAAMTLIAMPGGPPHELLPRLRHLLEDRRGEESWPNRLTVAQLFINGEDASLSRQAIAVCLEALNYATQPWYDLPRSGVAVRKQAALILGQLDPIYRNRQIFDRLAQLMQEDKDAAVRDAAYGALMRLAAAPEEKR